MRDLRWCRAAVRGIACMRSVTPACAAAVPARRDPRSCARRQRRQGQGHRRHWRRAAMRRSLPLLQALLDGEVQTVGDTQVLLVKDGDDAGHRSPHRQGRHAAAGESRRRRRQQSRAQGARQRDRRVQARIAGSRGAARGREGTAERRRRGPAAGDQRRAGQGDRCRDQGAARADAGVDPTREHRQGDAPRGDTRARRRATTPTPRRSCSASSSRRTASSPSPTPTSAPKRRSRCTRCRADCPPARWSDASSAASSLGSILLLAALGLAITYGLDGRHQHGARRADHDRRLHDLRRAEPVPLRSARRVRRSICCRRAGGVRRVGAGRHGCSNARVIRFLYGRPLETLLATWGISLILMQTVRTIFGAQNVQVENPSWMSGGIEAITGVVLPWSRIVIIGFAALVLVLMWLLLTRTRLGLFVRAVTQNRAMASCTGVPTRRVDTLAFGLGSGIAGLAGCALSQIGNVGPDLGQSYIVDSFMVVVLGGVGQLAGTVYAAMGLGIVNKFLEAWSGAVLAKIAVLVFIIVFIQKRPQGLFALKGGRSRRDDSHQRGVIVRRRSTTIGGCGVRAHDRYSGPRFARLLPAEGWVFYVAAALVLFVVFPILHLVVPADSVAAPVGLHRHADRQDHVLRDRRAGDGPDLGLHRHPVARPRPVLRARRLRDGHVPDALDRPRRRVSERPAGLHGVPRLESVSVVLELHRSLLVRALLVVLRSRAARVRVRLLRVPLAHQGRVFLDHHAGADLRVHAAVLPQRHGLRRQQRLHRLQAHPRLSDHRPADAHGAVRGHRRGAARAFCCSDAGS